MLRVVSIVLRAAPALPVWLYLHTRYYGPASWFIPSVVAYAVYRLVLAYFPLRPASAAFDDTSHGTASFAGRGELKAAGNLAPVISSTRYVLGAAREPYCAGPVSLLHRRQRATASYVTTGSKFACDGGRVDDGHLITIASAGSGKGIAVVQPNLRCYEGPVVALDPKGENFLRSYEARLRLGHRICLIDPFGTIPETQRAPYLARLNPLDTLEAFYQQGNHAAVFDECKAIAEMIVVRDGEKDPHWNEKAASFIRAAIMFVCYGRGYQNREQTPLSLATVKDCIYEYFSKGDEGIQTFIKRCADTPSLQASAGQVATVASSERSSVLSTVLRHTDFLDSPNVRSSLGATDFNLLDLKTEKLTVYLVLPATHLQAYAGLSRLWVGSLLRAMMRDALVQPRWRVLFLLDEVATLGALESIEQAMALGRGYGIDMWLLYQNIFQMQAAYGESEYEGLIANAAVQQFFGVRDVTTAEYVSKKLGQSTIRVTSQTRSTSENSGSNWSGSSGPNGKANSTHGGSAGRSSSAGMSVQQTGRALLTPDEVMRLPQDQLVIFFASKHPVLTQQCSVLDPEIVAALDAVQPVDRLASRPARPLHIAGPSPAPEQGLPLPGGASAGAVLFAQWQGFSARHERGGRAL